MPTIHDLVELWKDSKNLGGPQGLWDVDLSDDGFSIRSTARNRPSRPFLSLLPMSLADMLIDEDGLTSDESKALARDFRDLVFYSMMKYINTLLDGAHLFFFNDEESNFSCLCVDLPTPTLVDYYASVGLDVRDQSLNRTQSKGSSGVAPNLTPVTFGLPKEPQICSIARNLLPQEPLDSQDTFIVWTSGVLIELAARYRIVNMHLETLKVFAEEERLAAYVYYGHYPNFLLMNPTEEEKAAVSSFDLMTPDDYRSILFEGE